MMKSKSYRKIVDVDGYEEYISKNDMANLFYVYDDPQHPSSMRYNINRTIMLKGLQDVPVSSFEYYEVQDKDTWNMIAYKLYGDVRLWWMIAKANDIHNACIEPRPGWLIRVLSKDMVEDILSEMRGG